MLSCEQFPSNFPNSPDNKYKAIYITSEKGKHYQIIDFASKQVYLTTHAQFTTPNDVKAGYFSDDSKRFSAAYHYGHKGNYTWIGTWDIKTGKLLRYTTTNGWTKNISLIINSQTNNKQ